MSEGPAPEATPEHTPVEAPTEPTVGTGIPAVDPAAPPAATEPALGTGQEASWRDGIADARMKDHHSLATFKSLDDLAKSYIHAQDLIGRQGVKLPKDGDAEDQERFFSQLGRPSTAGDYDMGDWRPPEGINWDKGLEQSMKESMHEAGLTSPQVKSIIASYADTQARAMASMNTEAQRHAEEAQSLLQIEWGNGYDAKIDVAGRAIKMAMQGDADKTNDLLNMRLQDGSRLGDSPHFIRLAANLGAKMSEHSVLGDSDSRFSALTPSEAQRAIGEKYLDKDFMEAVNTKEHPGHASAMQEMEGLQKAAHPESASESGQAW